MAKCKYCDKELSPAGLKNHEKSCPKNPANIKEEAVEVVKQEEQEEKVEQVEEATEATEDLVVVEKAPEKTVKIKVKERLESFIGTQYYRLEKGQVYDVPENVKEILMRAGVLDAI